MPINRDSEFSESEFLTALKLLYPEDEATQLARAIAAPLDDREVAFGAKRVSGLILSDDLLILMSLISDDLARKVAHYIEADPRFATPEEQARWDERRREIRDWLDASPRGQGY